MTLSSEPAAGSWILLAGPRSMNATMLVAIARLGQQGALRVLDCGNRFNAYTVARAARGRPEVLNRITVSRAFTCYQVLSALEGTPASRAATVVLDMLSTFYDESVQGRERRRLLQVCITHLGRLERDGAPTAPCLPAGEGCVSMTAANRGVLPSFFYGEAAQESPPRLMVSVHPPAVPSRQAMELMELLQSSTLGTFFVQPAASAAQPKRLF